MVCICGVRRSCRKIFVHDTRTVKLTPTRRANVMLNRNSLIVPIIASCICVVAHSEPPRDWLATYEGNLKVLMRHSFKAETVTRYESPHFNFSPRLTMVEYRQDGNRVDTIREERTFLDATLTETKLNSKSRSIFDGREALRYTYPAELSPNATLPGNIVIGGEEATAFANKAKLGGGTASNVLFGIYSTGSGGLTIPEIMKASTREQLAVVTEATGVVTVRANTEYGAYEVEFDSRSGMPHRILIVKGPGDRMHVGQLSEIASPGAYYSPWHRKAPLAQLRVTVEDIKYTEFDGQLFPVSASVTEHFKYADGNSLKILSSHTRHDVQLDPDFDAMRAFVLEAPDGTPVSYISGYRITATNDKNYSPGIDVRSRTGVMYEWHRGKVVPSVDRTAIETLESTLAMSPVTTPLDHSVSSANAEGVTGNGSGSHSPRMPPVAENAYRSLINVAVAAFVLVCITGTVLFTRRKRLRS